MVDLVLLNVLPRLKQPLDPVQLDLVDRLAWLLDLDRERLRLWTFARLAVESGDGWADVLPIARALAP